MYYVHRGKDRGYNAIVLAWKIKTEYVRVRQVLLQLVRDIARFKWSQNKYEMFQVGMMQDQKGQL